MFGLKRMKRENLPTTKLGAEAGTALSKAFLNLQRRWAERLSQYEKDLTIKQKKIGILIFCIAMSSISGSLLYTGLSNNNQNRQTIPETKSITRPENITLPDSLDLNLLQEYDHAIGRFLKSHDSTTK